MTCMLTQLARGGSILGNVQWSTRLLFLLVWNFPMYRIFYMYSYWKLYLPNPPSQRNWKWRHGIVPRPEAFSSINSGSLLSCSFVAIVVVGFFLLRCQQYETENRYPPTYLNIYLLRWTFYLFLYEQIFSETFFCGVLVGRRCGRQQRSCLRWWRLWGSAGYISPLSGSSNLHPSCPNTADLPAQIFED